MIGMRAILILVAIMGTFGALFMVIIGDTLYLVSQPTWGGVEQIVMDVGKLVLSSQTVIKDAIASMGTERAMNDPSYSTYLLQRLIAASILTAVIVYAAYWGLSKLPVLHGIAPIYTIIIAIVLVGLVQVVAAATLENTIIYPYQGFVSIIENRTTFMGFINQSVPVGRFNATGAPNATG